MAEDPMEAIRAASAAAREGMGIEASQDQESVETQVQEDSPAEEPVEESEQEESEQEETEESTEGEQEETSEEHQPRDRSVFRQLNEIRSQKRESDAAIKDLLESIGAESIADAKDKISALRAAAPMSPEYIELAKELGVEDPENLRKLSDFMVKQVENRFSPIKNELESNAETIRAVQADREFSESMEHFDGEWKSVLPLIEQEYKPTATKLQEAYDYLAEVSHSEEYYDKELDYVLYKEQANLENILGAPKRSTMLSGRAQPQVRTQERLIPKSDGTHEGILKARERMRQIASRSEFEDENSNSI